MIITFQVDLWKAREVSFYKSGILFKLFQKFEVKEFIWKHPTYKKNQNLEFLKLWRHYGVIVMSSETFCTICLEICLLSSIAVEFDTEGFWDISL